MVLHIIDSSSLKCAQESTVVPSVICKSISNLNSKDISTVLDNLFAASLEAATIDTCNLDIDSFNHEEVHLLNIWGRYH